MKASKLPPIVGASLLRPFMEASRPHPIVGASLLAIFRGGDDTAQNR